jgi:hypothetical protein
MKKGSKILFYSFVLWKWQLEKAILICTWGDKRLNNEFFNLKLYVPSREEHKYSCKLASGA